MIVLYICIFSLILFLRILAEKEDGDAFTKVARFLHKRFSQYFSGENSRREKKIKAIERELKSLHPGEPIAYHLAKFEVDKLRMALLILAVGCLVGILYEVKLGMEKRILADGYIRRQEFGEESTEMDLYYRVGNKEESIRVTIPPRALTQEEWAEEKSRFRNQLFKIMLGENRSAENVATPLRLVSSIDDFPFSVVWSSENYELVDLSGAIGEEVKAGTEVLLWATISYEDVTWVEEFSLVLQPEKGTGNQMNEKVLEALRQNIQKDAQQEMFPLPEEVGGEMIQWREKKPWIHYLYFPMLLAALGSILWGTDRDIVQKREERQKKLLEEYPILLHKFTVFLGAGMNVKGIFFKLSNECGNDEKENPLGQELLLSVRELQAGRSEERVYNDFGQRIGLTEYKRFSTILVQTLKKGNDALATRLGEECDDALREHRNLKKKKGEETENSLLIPMILMLVVVMLMVLFPALISIQL